MKPFAFLCFAAALGGVISLSVVPADAQSPAPQATPRDEAARLDAAKDLAAVISKDTAAQIVTEVTSHAWPPVEQALRAKNPSIDAGSVLDLRKEFERIQLEFLFNVLKEAPAVYARHFTEQELRDVLAFYRTPTGAKTLQVMPQISAEIINLIAPRLPNVMSQTNEAFTKILSQRGFRP